MRARLEEDIECMRRFFGFFSRRSLRSWLPRLRVGVLAHKFATLMTLAILL